MTERTPTPDDDEIVSATLDGEATEAERARVLADEALQRRADSFRAVADAVGQAPQPPAGADDAAISAALDHLPRRPDELAGRRSRRRGTSLLAVAAVVVLFTLGVAIATSIDSADQSLDTAADELEADVAEEGGGDDASGAGSAGADQEASDSGSVADRGETAVASEPLDASDLDDLTRQVRLRLARTQDETVGGDVSTSTTAATAAPEAADGGDLDAFAACDLRAGAARSLGRALLLTTGFLEGRPVFVGVFADPDGGQVMVVRDAECQPVAELAL